MSNLNININLKAIKGAAVTNIKGKTATKRCLVIPIDDSCLYEGLKGVYLNLVGWESNKLADGKTHLLKQSVAKEVYETMTDEERSGMLIIGDVKPFGRVELGSDNIPASISDENYDDLPF